MLSVQLQVLGTVPGSRRIDEAHSGCSFLIQLRVFELPPHPAPGISVMSPFLQGPCFTSVA